MRVTIETRPYNDRRYSRPWIGKIVSWTNGRPEIAWGSWYGQPGDEGILEIEADPGDIIRHGQKDQRGNKGDNEWAILQADGSLQPTTEPEARQHWVARG